VRILSTVDDDGDRRRTVDDQSDKQQVEIVRRKERPGDSQPLDGPRPLEGESVTRRPDQRLVRVLAGVAAVDNEFVDSVLHLDVAIAGRTDGRCRAWRASAVA